ncbi:MAG: DUF1330 domain-containing protein [Methyloligellaceae bacterium]
MPTYAIAQIIVEDRKTLGKYREQAGNALAKHGGSIITAGPVAETLELSMDKPDVLALLSFPSRDAALAWRNDPELREIHALRTKSGKSTIMVLS